MRQWDERIAPFEGEKKTDLERLISKLPASDLDGCDFGLLAAFVDHALMLRHTVPWCAALDEEVFFEYVLYPRINDEDLSDHRALFYGELYPRIQGMIMEEAVLEANRWSHEIATYQEQDDRTASPLTVYRSGSGRCGEESTFVVAALRSVGIPARQVYAPRWSHCNDNHAWVEALCNGRWRFFGACEPEPVLDKGWFNAAAARAVLIHTRRFAPGQHLPEDGSPLGRDGCLVHYNQTHRYAQTKTCTVIVTKDGAPAAGIPVRLQVLNDAKLVTIARLVTGEDGSVRPSLGMGDVHVAAGEGEEEVSQLFHGRETDGLTVELGGAKPPQHQWEDFDFRAPAAPEQAGVTLTTKQKQERAETLGRGNQLRQRRVDAFRHDYPAGGAEVEHLYRQARGNVGEIHAFLTRDTSPLRLRLLRALCPKDLRDITAAVLEDHLTGAAPFADAYPAEVFDRYLLNPRVAHERLTVWREKLADTLSARDRMELCSSPECFWSRFGGTVASPPPDQLHPGLFWPPDVALAHGRCDETSKRILLIALLRTVGVPARQSPLDGVPEYWRDGRFVPVERRATGVVEFRKEPGQRFRYGKAWGLSRREGGEWIPMTLSDGDWEGDTCRVELPVGQYRILTTTRLPIGDQLASRYVFSLTAGNTPIIALRQRTYRMEDHLISRQLPGFSAQALEGGVIDNTVLGNGRCALLFWLEEGAEPTEHVLNELTESAADLQKLPVDVYFFVRQPMSLQQATLAALLDRWPAIRVGTGDWEDTVENLARQLYCDPDRPPLTVACDPRGRAVYAASGYNVSAVQLLVQIVRQLHTDSSPGHTGR